MSLFNFNQEEMLTFFAVLVRYSVLFAVLPFVGDRYVPAPVKILLALAVTMALFPGLVASGQVRPGEAIAWAATSSGIIGTIAGEAIVALVLGYTARLVFDSVNLGGNLMGGFMGLSMASVYDPEQQSQTQIVAEIQMILAMLLFLVLDGHHLMLRASLQSYGIVGLGGTIHAFSGAGSGSSQFSEKLIMLTGQVIRFGLQLAAPVALVLFAINLIFGVLAKAMPQLNILVLSMAVSVLVGLSVMFLSLGEFNAAVSEILEKIGEWMNGMLQALATGR